MLEIAQAGAAIAFVGGDPEDAQRTELAPEIGGKVVDAVDLGRPRRDLLGGEAAHLVAQRVGGLAKAEIEIGQAIGNHRWISLGY